MKLHPRFFIVQTAERELKSAALDIRMKHELTEGEMVSILCGMIARESVYIIRAERHPDNPDKRGDEA